MGKDVLEAYHAVMNQGESLHAISPKMEIECMCENDDMAAALQKLTEERGLGANVKHGPAGGAVVNLNLGILIGLQMGRNEAKIQQEVQNLEEQFKMRKDLD